MEISQAQEMLQREEVSVGKVGLKMNSGNTKFMSYNQQDEVTIRTNEGTELEQVSNFKYLGAWMHTCRVNFFWYVSRGFPKVGSSEQVFLKK